jgi:hypothetical protein
VVESGFLLRSCGVISSTEGSNPFLSAIYGFLWNLLVMTLHSDLQALLSTQGMQAFRMKSFYGFFFRWGLITLTLVYTLLLLPIKFTADASLHAVDTTTVLMGIHFAMWHDQLRIYDDKAWTGKPRKTPRAIEDAVYYLLKTVEGQPVPLMTPMKLPHSISSGDDAKTMACGGAIHCYKTVMDKRHFGVLAFDTQNQRLIYDADGGVQSLFEHWGKSLNVMTLFPLRDDKPFVFRVVEGHLLQPLKTSKTNRLKATHLLYGVFPLFEKNPPALPADQPLFLKAF